MRTKKEFGVAKLEQLPWTNIVDTYMHYVQPLPGCLPGLCHGQRAFALGAGGEQTLLSQRPSGRIGRRPAQRIIFFKPGSFVKRK